jgi:hypothetical protein
LKEKERHEQVKKAHQALEKAIKYVKETKGVGGVRRKRLVLRLERLDRQLKREHTKAAKVLDEAIEDLEFAVKH